MPIPEKPEKLRVIVFIDGQNFYNDCKSIFGHGETHPHLLGPELCRPEFGTGRVLEEVRFYTGIHGSSKDPVMNSYMSRRLNTMDKNGIVTIKRQLKYSVEAVEDRYNPGKIARILKGREKGIDVRIALDMVMLAIEGRYEVASLVSTDTDLEEAIKDIYELREKTGKWLTVENIVCQPPVGGPVKRLRSASRYIKIDQNIYDRIRDDFNYWPS